MPRPMKCRRVGSVPTVNYFKPAGVPLRMLDEVCLTVEEVEAVRLKDLEGLEQEQCAEKMNISRPTFQRILRSGRKKIADALLNGKAIKIEGGNFEVALRNFRCLNGHEWEVPFEVMLSTPPDFCPTCNTPEIVSLQPSVVGSGVRCRGGNRRWGHTR